MPPKPIEIDLRRDLPKVLRQRKALAKRLGDCRYTAPCVIGVMVPAGKRAFLDDAPEEVAGVADGRIGTLIKAGLVTSPSGQRADLSRLQKAFDQGDEVGGEAIFARTLTRLEAKYLQPATGQGE